MKNKIHINFFFPKKSKIIKLDNFIKKIINKIKDKNLINYSGYINNEELHENLLINIGDKNIENYKNISLFRKHKINKYIIEAIKKCNKKIIIPNDLFYAFENIIKINLQGFAPKRSIPTVKQALYRWFKKYLNVNLHGNGVIYIQNVVLNNAEAFSKLFDQSIKDYKPVKENEIKEKIKELEEWNKDWEIVENRNYNPYTYKKYDNYKLNIYEPCYLNLDNNLEKDFVEFLENNKDKIEWWFQNGNEHMALNFGIKYNTKSTFQPDFIVMLKDGRIGIFDTKASGDREDENKIKSEALIKYIREENKKGKKLFGGLVIKNNNQFRIYKEKNYISFKENQQNWECLEF